MATGSTLPQIDQATVQRTQMMGICGGGWVWRQGGGQGIVQIGQGGWEGTVQQGWFQETKGPALQQSEEGWTPH